MPSYRFCRPDDIPYLVRALEECHDVHFPERPRMTVDAFRAEMKELDVWPSNSLVASSEDGPIAVLIGTKRPREVQVRYLGVRPDQQRRGHARHLLDSLRQKLAVLGPDRLVAEVPRDLAGVGELFAAAGYRREAELADYRRGPRPVEPVPAEWVLPITVDELRAQDLLPENDALAWERRVETLVNRKDSLAGWAVASPEEVEAFVLARDADGATEVVAAGCRDPERADVFLGVLLRWLASRHLEGLRIPKLLPGEMPAPVLAVVGFERARVYDRWSVEAQR